ncbi:MAG: cytochrome c biogenesis protein CcsA [Cyclobacteriaceae bacterium]
MLGNLGHLLIIIAFVSITIAIYAYFKGSTVSDSTSSSGWTTLARSSYFIHLLAVVATVATLFSIIYFHHFEYHYAWKHSSRELPWYFMISCFWEGQEGSFLLWIFWNAFLGLILIKTAKHFEQSTMTVFCTIQFFLLSMILGAYFGGGMKVGSSPFLLLRDVMSDDVFKTNPDFIPANGTGLNPLLQNIWMVIHPPVIFLGFALSGVPFAFAIAALWKGKLKTFIAKTAPWLMVTVGVVGIGIMMGAYWAYETLNFGGYWNWDPVENAILVPWLVMLAAVHGMVLYRRKEKGFLPTISLVISGFLLIVYSTFLTRSGILGNSSVHAFTDLGLSGQLLLFLIFFVLISVGMLVYNRKSLTSVEQNLDILSLEFWMLLGICVIGLSAFQVLIPTSIPVFNVIIEAFGSTKSFAPPTDPIGFYSKYQLWFAAGFCILSAFAQSFYWKKIKTKQKLENEMILPLVATLVVTSIFVLIGKTRDLSYIFLIGSCVYLLSVCIFLSVDLLKSFQRTSLGGILAHMGMAVMLLGFVYSAGHQRIISQNLTINALDSGLPAHNVQQNILLSRNVPKENNDYSLSYQSRNYELLSVGTLIPSEHLINTSMNGKKIVKKDFTDKTGSTYRAGETLHVNTENTYYTIDILEPGGDSFTISPRMQNNPQMGYIASPDIKSYPFRDIYTHITNFPDPEKVEWNEPLKAKVSIGQSLEVDGLEIVLTNIAIKDAIPNIALSQKDIALEASISVSDEYHTYEANPVFHVSADRSIRFFPDEVEALGTKVLLSGVNPASKEYELTVMTSQRDWITLKSIEMPMISLVWVGFLIMVCGIGVAFYNRLVESKSTEDELVISAVTNEMLDMNNVRMVVNH